MSLFLLLANYVGALVAVQMLRGDLSSQENMNFKEIYNSFLAMYQVHESQSSMFCGCAHLQSDFLLGELDYCPL